MARVTLFSVAFLNEDIVSALASFGGPYLYRWAGVKARSDSPSVYELVEAGWVPVAHDTRYGSTLCMLEERPARRIADHDEAAAIVLGRVGGAS